MYKRIFRRLVSKKTRLDKIKTKITRFVGDFFLLTPSMIKYQGERSPIRKRVLIVGVVLQDRKNHYKHISSELSKSKYHEVHQIWAVLKSDKKLQLSDNVTHVYFDEFIPRSALINTMINKYSSGTYDYIIITDDDIRLPKNFLDQFLIRQELFDFSLAQPARTPTSLISHTITKQRRDLLARQTLFVEIGPLISIRNDVHDLILPLDEGSPMGWGLDYVWPSLLLDKKKKMGIIDSVPIAHTLRPTGKSYGYDKAKADMENYLSLNSHLKVDESHTVLVEYTK